VPLDPSVPPSLNPAARPFVVPGNPCPIVCFAAPPGNAPLDEAGARTYLFRFLLARGAAANVHAAALSQFNDPSTVAIIADPTLRASLLMLSG